MSDSVQNLEYLKYCKNGLSDNFSAFSGYILLIFEDSVFHVFWKFSNFEVGIQDLGGMVLN